MGYPAQSSRQPEGQSYLSCATRDGRCNLGEDYLRQVDRVILGSHPGQQSSSL
jgi:putative hemolysin